jgi:malonate transporter and related proteins
VIDILLNALVPIFAVMGLGYFAGWIRDVDNRHVAELNALVMDFALPASLFVAMATTPSAVLLSQWPLFVTFLVSYLLLYAVSYAMQRRLFRLPPADAAIQALTIAFPNNAAAGLPLIAAVFGPGNIVSVALSIAVGSIFLSPLTLGILEANEAAASRSKGAGASGLAIGALSASRSSLARSLASFSHFAEFHWPPPLSTPFNLSARLPVAPRFL